MNTRLRSALGVLMALFGLGCAPSPGPPQQITAAEILQAERTPYRVPAVHPELRLLHTLSAELQIVLTQAPVPIGNSANLRALPTARIQHLALTADMLESRPPVARPLTVAELASVAFRAPTIRIKGIAGDPVEHIAPNGQYFTLAELLRAIEATERSSRDQSEWFGGIDVHHIYFEGLVEETPGIWTAEWGS